MCIFGLIMKVRSIIFISVLFLLAACNHSVNKTYIDLYKSNKLTVSLVDTMFSIDYHHINIYKKGLSQKFGLNYNEKWDLLFINDSCFSNHNFDTDRFNRYKESSSIKFY